VVTKRPPLAEMRPSALLSVDIHAACKIDISQSNANFFAVSGCLQIASAVLRTELMLAEVR
jgi:hypothetical protein